MLKKILLLTLCASTSLFALTPYYAIRSQGENAARDLVGETNFINLDGECATYGTFVTLFEYTHSFRPNTFTECLFGPDLVCNACGNQSINISGSRTENRGSTDWLADYFGLPTDFKGSVAFKPYIENFIINLGFYIGLDAWLEGLYFKVDAPITYSRWQMQMDEVVQFAGVNPYDAGYFSAGTNFPLLNNFTEFITGSTAVNLTESTVTYTQSVFDNLGNAKISLEPQAACEIAEFRAVLGWNRVYEDSHIGLNVRFAAPTGTKPCGEFAFEPVVGNGHHWQLGVGFTSHHDIWYSQDETSHVGFYCDANLTHLFKARQRRTFDLKNKPNSRYMLAQKIGATQLPAHLANPPFPAVEFQSEFSPVANLTTFDVDVEISVQGDVVALFNYTNCGLTFDFGYNFWATSCEKIIKNGLRSPIDDGATWALKGDAYVIGFEDVLPTFPPVRLAATESKATIHAGTNFPAAGTKDPAIIALAQANPNIDTPQLAETNANEVLTAPNAGAENTRSSLSPFYLNPDEVDLVGTQGLSNKVFAHVSYAWELENWTPYLGGGFEVEFGSNGKNTTNVAQNCDANTACKTKCNPCVRCSVTQVGLWLKGGVAF